MADKPTQAKSTHLKFQPKKNVIRHNYPSQMAPASSPGITDDMLIQLDSDLRDLYLSHENSRFSDAEQLLSQFNNIDWEHVTDRHKSWISAHYLILTRIYTALKLTPKALRTAWRIIKIDGYKPNFPDQAGYPDKFKLGVDWWPTEGIDRIIVEAWAHISKAYGRLGSAMEDQKSEADGCLWSAYEKLHGDMKNIFWHRDMFEEDRDKLIGRPMFEGKNLANTVSQE